MPLTPQDELLCHQLPTTFDHVLQSDLRWTERVVLYACDPSTGTSVMTGLARYPNRNVIDAYAMVTIDNVTAHVVRLSREADSEPGELTRWCVGPFSYEVVEPLHRVHFSLEPNEHGISLDLDFVGDFPAYEQTPAFHRSHGRVREDARRFYQNGRLSGRVDVNGTVIDIDPERWPVAGRDHSWGTRQGGGGGSLSEGTDLQPPDVPDGVLYVMGIFQFDDEIVHFAQREDSRGQVGQFEGERLRRLGDDRTSPTILRVDHDLTFRDDLRIVRGGEFTVHDSTGAAERYTVEPIANFWPGLAGYDAYGGYSSGMWRGRSFGDGFAADVTDPEVLRQVSMLSETLVEVRHGDRVGHGLVEMVFMGAYPRYGYDGW
jgi:hypothetical protein